MGVGDDYPRMDCLTAQDAISAQLDAEDPGVDPAELEAHVGRCPTCAAFAGGAGALLRPARIRSAEPVPDLVSSVLARVAAAPRRNGARRRSAGRRRARQAVTPRGITPRRAR